MTLSILSPGRTVLLMADDALYVYKAGSAGVRFLESVPWDADGFEAHISETITRDCGGKPVLLLNDMVEQHYRKERVLRTGVGAMDRKNMLRRKLNAAFPNYPVRAALPLKEKVSDGKQKADLYIFSAVPNSTQLAKSIDSVTQSYADISGFCLLPVESADMLRALSAKLSKAKKSKWCVFIAQHKHGGLRQIVTRDGDLALTRITPISEQAGNMNAWVDEVHQEFKATMSYLLRFGYQPEEGLDVILISNQTAGDRLQALIENDCNFSVVGVAEAARLIGLPIDRHDTETLTADVLHVGWAARKSKYTLPMTAPQIDAVSKPRKTAMAASFILFLGALGLGYMAFSEVQNAGRIKSETVVETEKNAQLTVQYQREVERKEKLGYDIRLIQSAMSVYGQLQADTVKPLTILQDVGKSLGKDLRIDRIDIDRPDANQGTVTDKVMETASGKTMIFRATMQMTYPSTSNIDKGNAEVQDLQKRLQQEMPEYQVQVTKFLKDYEYVEEIVVESGDVDKEDIKQDFVAEITITGWRQNAADPGT